MKPRHLLFLLPILIVALVFWAVTSMPDENSICQYALKYLGDELHGRVNVQTIALKWRPLPTLIATNLDISHANYTLKSDELSISLSISDILKNGISGIRLHTLRLNRPRLHLISSTQSQLRIPSIRLLEIIDGELTISTDYLGGQLISTDLLLSHIDTQATLSSDHILLKTLQCRSAFAQSIKLEGKIDLNQDSMHLKGTAKQLLPLAMPFSAMNNLDSLKQAILDLDFEAKGPLAIKGEKALSVTMNGAMPKLILQKKDGKPYEFAASNLSLRLQISENGYSLEIPEIKASKPQLELKGIVKKQVDSWDIDLSAFDIDLTGVRERVSGMLGNAEAARTTCEIVLGGRARTATFAFHGTTEEMKDLNNLLITADVERAPIFIPKAGLKLDEASGPIKIERGALSGYGLSAKMGNSTAFDSSLYLQITTDDDTFHLKLNLNADLAELPPILNKFATSREFREELKHVIDAKGRAKGQLELGPRLNDMNVQVTVQDVQGEVRYDRITWPIAVNHGQLFVELEPFLVKWHDISAKIGPHTVEKLCGLVDYKSAFRLNIENGTAKIDMASLQEELFLHEVIRTKLASVLQQVRGELMVSAIKVTGPFFRPTAWMYQLTSRIENGGITSPLLNPKNAEIRTASLQLTDQTLRISSATIQIDDTDLQLKGELLHEQLQDWHGDVAFTGLVNKGFHAWLREKGWSAPPAFTPKLPYLLQELHVDCGSGLIKIFGGIVPGSPSTAASRINLDITIQDSKPVKSLIEIQHSTGNCMLSVLWNNERNSIEALKWKGILNQEALNAVLEKNELLSGSISGDFYIKHAPDAAADWQFSGKIDVQELAWQWGLPRSVLIQRLIAETPTASQDINTLEIKQADVKIDHETIRLNGRLYNQASHLKFDLTASSDFVSWATLKTLFPKDAFEGQAQTPSKKRNVTGTLRFDAARFLYVKEQGFCPENNCSSTKFLWSPMHGELEFLPENIHLTIAESELCGMASRGTWEGNNFKEGRGSFQLFTDLSHPVMAQNLMQCLGYPQHILEGPLNIDITVHGNPEFFEKGSVRITSTNGKIYKLTFLAKVFGLLNLTDIFKNALPDLASTGFSYSSLEIAGDIENDQIILQKNVIRGTGLNLFIRGSIVLKDMNGDLVMIIAPFKTIDAILTKIPFIGCVLGGKTGSILGIPVGVKGPLKDPQVNILPASAIGTGVLELVTDTIKLPFRIIEPILPTNSSNHSENDRKNDTR
ncbi:MAG: AsmA-like C-terminal domain-containing protein [Dissulfuribacterales bacterium]